MTPDDITRLAERVERFAKNWDFEAAAEEEISEIAAELRQLAEQGKAGGVPEGWKLVPIEYTKFMMDAAIRPGAQDQTGRREAAIWCAMLAAAPQPPAHSHDAGVTDEMVVRALNAQPFISSNDATRLWQMLPSSGKDMEAMRAALTAAIAPQPKDAA